MQTQTFTSLFNQDQVANQLQLKYQKILLTFFERDSSNEPSKKNTVIDTKIANKTKFLKLFSPGSDNNWTKMLEEIKKSK